MRMFASGVSGYSPCGGKKPGQILGEWELVAPISLAEQEAETKGRTQIYHSLAHPH